MLLDDSYKTTINGLNKSNVEAKNNFIILFKAIDNIHHLTKKIDNLNNT